MRTFPILFFLIIVIFNSCDENTITDHTKTQQTKPDKTYPKLFLLSKGLTTDTLKNEFLNFLGKDPLTLSVAVVVNASSTDKKKKKKVKKVKHQFSEIGFDSSRIELFDLMRSAPENLLEFDVVYILGGNPFLLLNEVNKSDAKKVFKELVDQEKILMGYSAGSLLLGPDLSLMDHVDTLLGFNETGLKELSCIGLYNFHIFPHYSEFTNQVPELISKIEEFESQSILPVYKLNDNQAILYDQGKVKIIGK